VRREFTFYAFQGDLAATTALERRHTVRPVLMRSSDRRTVFCEHLKDRMTMAIRVGSENGLSVRLQVQSREVDRYSDRGNEQLNGDDWQTKRIQEPQSKMSDNMRTTEASLSYLHLPGQILTTAEVRSFLPCISVPRERHGRGRKPHRLNFGVLLLTLARGINCTANKHA
jgi:hypothetical protein